jgi:uncharacterized RDD family membrane protein YckC
MLRSPRGKGPTQAELFEVLSHKIRRAIIQNLYEKVELSYTELLTTLKIGEGLLNFHLRKLKGFIEQTESGTYILSGNGKLAHSLMHTAHESLRVKRGIELTPVPTLSKGIVLRRSTAFLLDVFIFFIFTGVFLDPAIWSYLSEFVGHIAKVVELHPWIFHPEHLPMIGQLSARFIAVYAHILFAVVIYFTLLEAYKGQTPGKYLLGIRVVKVGGLKMGLLESGIRNMGKVFLLPLDLLVGIIFYRKRGYLRFFDYYTEVTVERVKLIKR